MRIVGGAYAGHDLTSPGPRVRPTSERVRGRWFEVLGPAVAGTSVLDLFSGSGALGLEAISRGADTVDFVENGPASLHALKANIAALRLRGRTRVFKRDAIPFVDALDADAYDIAFADPPYGSRKLDRVVTRWLEVPYSRILTVEHGREHKVPGKGKRYDFGETRVTVFTAR